MPKRVIRHLGRVINLRLDFTNKALWYQQIALLEGKEFELQIKQKHKKVSNDQYSYYYGIILTTCFETEMFSAFDKAADVHAYFEYKFLTNKKMLIIGDEKQEINVVDRLDKMTMKEMSEFVDRVLVHLREDLKINILTPSEYYENEFKTTIRQK